MRTTLTLDDDVAAALERMRKSRGTGLKNVVNEALREGLKRMHSPPARGQRFQTQVRDLGRLRIGSIDNVADAIAIAGGEAFSTASRCAPLMAGLPDFPDCAGRTP